MALTKNATKVTNISELATKPNATNGLSDQTFKALFDKSVLDTKTYLNETLTVELDTALGLKATQTTTYTKIEVDGIAITKANSSDVTTALAGKQKSITSGIGTPSGGTSGDIYIKYS